MLYIDEYILYIQIHPNHHFDIKHISTYYSEYHKFYETTVIYI